MVPLYKETLVLYTLKLPTIHLRRKTCTTLKKEMYKVPLSRENTISIKHILEIHLHIRRNTCIIPLSRKPLCNNNQLYLSRERYVHLKIKNINRSIIRKSTCTLNNNQLYILKETHVRTRRRLVRFRRMTCAQAI